MPFPADCDSALQNLRKLPTFAMSLGAKELFHTNFLAFLLESDDKSLEPIQSKLKELLFGKPNVGAVRTWREKAKLDLVVIPCDLLDVLLGKTQALSTTQISTIVIIEAKLKSIPSKKQLDQYDERLEGGVIINLFDDDAEEDGGEDPQVATHEKVSQIKIVLDRKNVEKGTITNKVGKSLSTKNAVNVGLRRLLLLPDGAEDFKIVTQWSTLTWRKVVQALQISIPSEHLLGRLVADYAQSLELILEVLLKTRNYVDLFEKNEISYQEFYENVMHNKFSNRRIGDLVGKYAMHLLETKVSAAVSHLPAPTGYELESYTHYSNGSVGVGFAWHSHTKPSKTEIRRLVGVQIQHYSYRHYISAEGGNPKERRDLLGTIAETMSESQTDHCENGWFCLGPDNLTMVPKKTSNGPPCFYVYLEDKFRYTQADLLRGEPMCFFELISAIESSLTAASERLTKNRDGNSVFQSIVTCSVNSQL